MQIFELYFNPKADKERVLDTFIYDPENLYEKRLGSLYMAGELKRPILGNPRFLTDLSNAVKNEYYNSELKKTPETNLKEALKKANQYLDEQTKKGNVGWLGNLSFAVLNYNNYVLNFAKTGEMKMLLIRGNEFLDIGENLEMQADQAYPLKVFSNMASGKLVPGDKILVLTKDAFSTLTQSNTFLKQLSRAEDEKGLKELIKNYKPLFAETSGICLVMMVTERQQQKKSLTFQNELPTFSFKEALWQPLMSLKPRKLFLPKPKSLPKLKAGISLAKFKTPTLHMKKPRMPKLRTPNPPKMPKLRVPNWKSKKLLSVVLLIVFLLFSFWIFKQEREIETSEAREKIIQAQDKIEMAENLMIIKKMEEAEVLFQEAIDIIQPLTKTGSPFQEEAKQLRIRAQEQLDSI